MENLRKVEWPEGARIAVVLQVAFEQCERATGSFALRAKEHLVYCSTLSAEWMKPGVEDMMLLSWDEYAGKVGIWRLIELLDKHNVTATGPFNGLAVERYPEATKAFQRGGGGREVCAHSWGEDVYSVTMDKEQMRANVRRCADVIEKATGVRPVGWVSPGGLRNEHTLPVLAEEGFIWHCDSASADVPFITPASGKRLVGMSLPWDVNDTFFVRSRIPPSHYVEIFCREFDVLYEEGGQIAAAVAHAGIYGHPFGIWAYDQVIKYAKGFPKVWFATRRQIAEWYLDHS